MGLYLHTRIPAVLALLAAVLLGIFMLDLLLGSVPIPPAHTISALMGKLGNPLEHSIIFGYRLPKALTALLAGAGLGVSGLLMQTSFRNPLAGPYILGVSAGACLGAAVALLAVGGVLLSLPLPLALSAWLGAMLSLVLVLLASMRLRSSTSLLVFGLMLSAAASAGVSVLQYWSSDQALKGFVLWSLGSMANVHGGALWLLGGAVVVGLLLAYLCVRPLDLLLLGQDQARHLGLSVGWSRVLIFTATTLLAGTVTAFCGPIGFIGIAAPHVARFVCRAATHRLLITATALVGASGLLLADLLAQLPGVRISLPINAVASLLGIPVVIYVLIKRPTQ